MPAGGSQRRTLAANLRSDLKSLHGDLTICTYELDGLPKSAVPAHQITRARDRLNRAAELISAVIAAIPHDI